MGAVPPGAADATPACIDNGYVWLRNRVAEHSMEIGSLPMAYEAGARSATVPADIAKTIESTDWGSGDVALVGKALAYVVHGGLDEAHNLVTPLSWPASTPFAGPPKTGGIAEHDASYLHALIHRREGDLIGEFGTGFHNSNYWWGNTGVHPVFPHLAMV